MLEVIDPGFHSTIQDVGRRGGNALGIPPSGAQDTYALRVGNWLVGNPTAGPLVLRDHVGFAGIETVLQGLKARALTDLVIAVTGADMTPTIDGGPVSMWEALLLKKNEVLEFGPAKHGMLTYLTIAGGFDVPLYFGSRATHIRASMGGVNGRALRAGDVLQTGAQSLTCHGLIGNKLHSSRRPQLQAPWKIRVVRGADDYMFRDESLAAFFHAPWKMTSKSDRTGFRLKGPQLAFKSQRPSYLLMEAGANPSNIVADPGAPVGTVQVPSESEIIVGGVDAPNIGGYARLGCVISIDMSRIGQVRPGEVVQFVDTSYEAAVELLISQETFLTQMNA